MYRKKLLELGIPPYSRGFEYLNQAIQLYDYNKRMMDIYQEIAEQYGTTNPTVERSMRHAISKTATTIRCGEFVAKYKILWDLEMQTQKTHTS